MKIISAKEVEKSTVTNFLITHWGSPQMVISSGIFQCDELDGFIAIDEKGTIIGLCTFTIAGNDCEIISLDSIRENRGIGTALIRRVEIEAIESGCQRINLITTNDNLHALEFYQKWGYNLIELFPNAVEKARKIKPEIPFVSDNGIPIQDEILLRKNIRNHESR